MFFGCDQVSEKMYKNDVKIFKNAFLVFFFMYLFLERYQFDCYRFLSSVQK